MKLVKRILKWTGIALLLVVLGGGLFLFVAYWLSTNDCEHNIAAPIHPMKAIRKCDYGVISLRDVEKPTPADNQILVKVRAASLNAADGHLLRGFFAMRPLTGMRKPKDSRFGIDCAGTVEAVGKNVTQFKPGDEVFGAANGAIAEYVCASQKTFVTKPNNITFEQAGSVAVAGLTALQGLRNQGRIQTGQKVLINGASGGVGTFAVQIAKAFRGEVTAVCSTRNVDLVKSIRADHVIDYTKEDFTKTDQHYDMLYDLVGNHSFSERRKILTPNGICVLAGIGGAGLHPGMMGRIAGNFWNAFLSNFTKQKFHFYIAKLTKADLNVLRELMESGTVSPVIYRTYKLNQTACAGRAMQQGL